VIYRIDETETDRARRPYWLPRWRLPDPV